MATSIKIKEEEKQQNSTNTENNNVYVLVLCNDDHNSFEFVMKTLITVCKQSAEQAEQCTMITHYNGKCDIKLGEEEYLISIKRELTENGLTAVVEKL
jgi:ATP-dependent Clp protease adaptor protein ClpS